MALNTVELMPSATSNSPFSLGLVKLWSRPEPNILEHKHHAGFNFTSRQQNRPTGRQSSGQRPGPKLERHIKDVEDIKVVVSASYDSKWF
ncbi:hypothetical protein EYF80_062285 [Liparis tanakae]|uniref:Uncharacterized protein n=1 Tax=Liparis tanakae TaxID=230148 RepID=A0A4Z2EFA3_9TELE|nr:hypothetical protein EYF80_062285 [Liparis tanakae]